jgi:hypothetical protein
LELRRSMPQIIWLLLQAVTTSRTICDIPFFRTKHPAYHYFTFIDHKFIFRSSIKSEFSLQFDIITFISPTVPCLPRRQMGQLRYQFRQVECHRSSLISNSSTYSLDFPHFIVKPTTILPFLIQPTRITLEFQAVIPPLNQRFS